jgi:hypothetical protein
MGLQLLALMYHQMTIAQSYAQLDFTSKTYLPASLVSSAPPATCAKKVSTLNIAIMMEVEQVWSNVSIAQL